MKEVLVNSKLLVSLLVSFTRCVIETYWFPRFEDALVVNLSKCAVAAFIAPTRLSRLLS
jgi:hypothetical protein